MRKLKYVIVDGSPIIFTEDISHDTFRHLNPTSAGFVSIAFIDGKVSADCFGESWSLNIKSHPDDSAIVTKKLTDPYW